MATSVGPPLFFQKNAIGTLLSESAGYIRRGLRHIVLKFNDEQTGADTNQRFRLCSLGTDIAEIMEGVSGITRTDAHYRRIFEECFTQVQFYVCVFSVHFIFKWVNA